MYLNGCHLPTTFFTDPTGLERAWWNSNEARTEYFGIQETLSSIKKFNETDGPFKGIVGFSQGACCAALAASVIENVAFTVIIGGFLPNPLDLQEILKGFKGKSLHVSGERDELVPPSGSRKLQEFLKGEFLSHPDGHVVPSKAIYRNEIIKWISHEVLL